MLIMHKADLYEGGVGGDDRYASYLLRLWFDERLGRWRLLLRSVQYGTEHRFESLDSMVQFLQSQTPKPPLKNQNKQGGQL